MKISISRQNIYLLVLSIFLLIFVLFFSFMVLIPKGQEYREKAAELKKVNRELRWYQNFNDETSEILHELRRDNRHIITAFDTKFNAARFEKQHKKYFDSLSLSKKVKTADLNGDFVEYEVNATSKINSPKSFYNFLDAINKSDWIVGVNFPINFKRDGELIHSSFTMQIYYATKDSNFTKKEDKKESVD